METDHQEGSRVQSIRGNKKVRIVVILALLAVVAALFIFWGKAKIALGIIFVILLAALGMEVASTDYDLGKMIETKSFEQSQVQRDSAGNVLFDRFGEETTDTTKGKQADAYNCDDFSSQPEAQAFYQKVGGRGNDVNRLDGNKDGQACESLPKGTR